MCLLFLMLEPDFAAASEAGFEEFVGTFAAGHRADWIVVDFYQERGRSVGGLELFE